WDSLSKWFIKQFYFTKTIATVQKSNGKSVAFFGDIRDYCPRLNLFYQYNFKSRGSTGKVGLYGL
ncbi:hypothetical protein GEZ73_06635, partial [Streptococcus mitis]